LWEKVFSKGDMEDLGEAYAEGAKAGGESYDRSKAKKEDKEDAFALPGSGSASLPSFSNMGDSAISIAAEGGKSTRNVVVTINKLVETITVSVTNLKESKEQIKAQVAEALLTAVNDINLAN
jgi:hypothetical protein